MGIETHVSSGHFECRKDTKHFSFYVCGEESEVMAQKHETSIPIDYIFRIPEKVASLILSKLQANKKIFARKCEIKKVNKLIAASFLDQHHLLGAAQSGFNYGLYYEKELVALASFSKGRKMNRLKEHERSFELIRFCTKSGITVTGGLSRLIRKFCDERNAGDIMTYIDKQMFDGRSFISAGFKKHSESAPNLFLINKKTFERIPHKNEIEYDPQKFYLTQNTGNIKLVYTPNEQA